LLPVAHRIFLAAFVFRLFSALLAFLANVTFPPLQDQRFYVMRTPHPFWDTFARYDSGWYHGIASQGYVYAEGGRNNLAFFPLYPMLMRAGGWLLGARQEDFYFAGIVVSWLAFAGAMVLLYRLARLDLDERAAERAVLYTAIFPFAYFFGVVYSESLFLLTLVATTFALRTKRWVWAALAGAAMTATRVTGVIALPGLAWIAWRAAAGDRREQWKAAAAIVGCTTGFVGYCAYNYVLSGTPFAWYEAITRWNYEPGGNPLAMPLRVLVRVLSTPIAYLAGETMAPYDMLNTLAAVGALALVPLIWRRFGLGYASIVLGGLLLPLSSGQLEGLGRYTLVQFPIFIALASVISESRHTAWTAASAIFYAVCLALFATVHPLF
jgi:hypothetical protein